MGTRERSSSPRTKFIQSTAKFSMQIPSIKSDQKSMDHEGISREEQSPKIRFEGEEGGGGGARGRRSRSRERRSSEDNETEAKRLKTSASTSSRRSTRSRSRSKSNSSASSEEDFTQTLQRAKERDERRKREGLPVWKEGHVMFCSLNLWLGKVSSKATKSDMDT